MLVRIDRSTLRRNPTAGNTTSTLDTGLRHARASYRDDTGEFEFVGDADRLLCQEARGVTCTPTFNVGMVYSLSDFDLSRLRVSTICDIHTFHHRPEPDWLFDYEPTVVTCNECSATFPHSELNSDCTSDGDDEVCSFAICPKCGAWDCCDVEYERPESVAVELGLASAT